MHILASGLKKDGSFLILDYGHHSYENCHKVIIVEQVVSLIEYKMPVGKLVRE
jgi:SAM-dependent MidA family methyltransferase